MTVSTPTSNRHSRYRFARTTALIGAATLVLAGCNMFGDNSGGGIDEGGGDGADGGEATAEGQGGHITIDFNNFAHIDPQSVGGGMWLVQKGLLEGLVLQTRDGTDVRPAIAEDWEVTEDGLTHTFHLRQANWSDGEPITAQHFVDTYQRLLDPGRGTGGVTSQAPSYQATLGILNATEYSSGVVEDFEEVGVEAVDDSTLEFTLEAPNPGFVMGLTHPSMLPLPPNAFNDDENWQDPDNWVGNGPFNITGWVSNSSMNLEANPEYWDAENVALDSIDLNLIEAGSIVTTVPYESGEVDIRGLNQPADIERFFNDPELSEHVHLLENSGTTYLARLNSRNTLLEDPQIRSALNLGLGRAEIAGISEITQPASTLVSPIVPDWSEDIAAHDQMWGDEAVAEAQRLLAEAGYPDGEGFPTLHLLSGADATALDPIIDTWQNNLGIEVVKDVVEFGVYVERRAELHDEDYLGYWYGNFAGVSTWPNQVQQLWSPDFTRQHALTGEGYEQFLEVQEDPDLDASERNDRLEEILATMSDPTAQAYAERVQDVFETIDEEEQQEILRDAANLREEAEVIIPVFWNSPVSIAQPRVQGLELRAQVDFYYFKDLWVDDDAE